MSQSIKYSFVTCGRNDNYGCWDEQGGPTFTFRLHMGFESLRNQIGHEQSVEIIYVDADNSNPTPVPNYVKHIKIPSTVIKHKYYYSRFPFSVLMNAGVRRAKGEFIVAYIADDLFCEDFIEKYIATQPQKNSLIICSKHYTTTRPWFSGQVYWSGTKTVREMWDVLKILDCPHDDFESYYTATGHDIHGMHRGLWEKTRGYDEHLLHWGWVDQQLCMRADIAHIKITNIAKLGAKMYHMDHKTLPDILTKGPIENTHALGAFCANEEDWGLGNLGL